MKETTVSKCVANSSFVNLLSHFVNWSGISYKYGGETIYETFSLEIFPKNLVADADNLAKSYL